MDGKVNIDGIFARRPQTKLWQDVLAHLRCLRGARIQMFVNAPMSGSWGDFDFRGHSFAISDESGSFIFSLTDMDTPLEVTAEIRDHFIPYLEWF